MKRLIFMRHGYLEGKYRDYSTLNFEELEDLLLRKVNPSIDKDRTKLALKNKKNFSRVDFIVCSNQIRAIETAELARELTDVDSQTSPLLQEITFSRGIISTKDIMNSKTMNSKTMSLETMDRNHINLNFFREKILTQFYYSHHSENFDDAITRFLLFLEYTKTLNHNTILCITHGWFMRLIYIYSIKGSLKDVSLGELLEANVVEFLDTIEIVID